MSEVADREVIETPPLLVTVKEAGRLLGVSRSMVWAMIKSGRIRTTKIGRRTLPQYESLRKIAEGAA